MSSSEAETSPANSVAIFAVVAAFVCLIGLADSIYLTIQHINGEQVPCSIVEGCEQVLTSRFAVLAGIPLAAIGALAYFSAFSLATLTAFGNRTAWKIFGVQVSAMALASLWLIYLQAFVIHAFCQFCLLSALVTFSLFGIFLVSVIRSRKRSA
jgi:uncharacterized membrane protein